MNTTTELPTMAFDRPVILDFNDHAGLARSINDAVDNARPFIVRSPEFAGKHDLRWDELSALLFELGTALNVAGRKVLGFERVLDGRWTAHIVHAPADQILTLWLGQRISLLEDLRAEWEAGIFDVVA